MASDVSRQTATKASASIKLAEVGLVALRGARPTERRQTLRGRLVKVFASTHRGIKDTKIKSTADSRVGDTHSLRLRIARRSAHDEYAELPDSQASGFQHLRRAEISSPRCGSARRRRAFRLGALEERCMLSATQAGFDRRLSEYAKILRRAITSFRLGEPIGGGGAQAFHVPRPHVVHTVLAERFGPKETVVAAVPEQGTTASVTRARRPITRRVSVLGRDVAVAIRVPSRTHGVRAIDFDSDAEDDGRFRLSLVVVVTSLRLDTNGIAANAAVSVGSVGIVVVIIVQDGRLPSTAPVSPTTVRGLIASRTTHMTTENDATILRAFAVRLTRTISSLSDVRLAVVVGKVALPVRVTTRATASSGAVVVISVPEDVEETATAFERARVVASTSS